jgi:serine/threonine-protein kinase
LTTEDLSGRTLGDFRVVRKLGAGGMGEVYLARQLSLNRDVALKFLRPDLAADPVAVQRFQQEAEAVARLTHAHIVQVYAVGELAGRRFMALEFVDGRNLRELVDRKGPLPVPQAVAVLRQVAAALARAADAGLVHRDIKPDNLLVTRAGEVKVADFGLSRVRADDARPAHLTASGVALGTPLYMSPEQVQGQPVDHRSDLYALGVTAFFLLAGRPPFEGKTGFEVAVQHVQAEPPRLLDLRPDVPPPLADLVHRLMAKSPGDRPATAREVLRVLAGGPATSTSLPVLPPRPARRNRLVGVAAVLAMVVGWTLAGRRPGAGGLPTARPPEPFAGSRERELLAVTRNRESPPAAVFEAAVSLGLLYLGERRLDEAERVFADIEARKYDRPGGLRPTAAVVGRLGRAAVLAEQDRSKEALDLFDKTVGGLVRGPGQLAADKLLIGHPELARAVAAAVNRLAENHPPGQPWPDRLDWLRSPAGLLRGPR